MIIGVVVGKGVQMRYIAHSMHVEGFDDAETEIGTYASIPTAYMKSLLSPRLCP